MPVHEAELIDGARMFANELGRRVMKTDNAPDIQLDVMLENCIFYISKCMNFHTANIQQRHATNGQHIRFRKKGTFY